jgi:hypothetical protein
MHQASWGWWKPNSLSSGSITFEHMINEGLRFLRTKVVPRNVCFVLSNKGVLFYLKGVDDMDYKDTLLMPKTEFQMRGNLGTREPEFQARWKA